MAAATILSLETFRDAHRRIEVRQCLHDRFDAWLNRLEAHREHRTPTLEALTQAVFALRQELPQAVTEGVVEQAHRATLEQRTATCPQCGPTLSARGLQERTVETLVGAVQLRRSYFYCLHCQQSTTPWDEARQVTACRKQPDVQQAAVQLPTEVPYETACELFEQLTGLPPECPHRPRGDPSRGRGADSIGCGAQPGGAPCQDRGRGGGPDRPGAELAPSPNG